MVACSRLHVTGCWLQVEGASWKIRHTFQEVNYETNQQLAT